MAEGKKAHADLRELIGEFYRKVDPKAPLALGTVVRAPIPHLKFSPTVLVPTRANAREHVLAAVTARPLNDATDFRGQNRGLPLAYTDLSENEELLGIPAKHRPGVIVGMVPAIDPKSIPDGVQRRKASRAFDAVYFVAPMMSISTAADPRAFGPTITTRIKCFMYPQFMYLGKHDGPDLDGGVVRLDHMITTHLGSCVRPIGLAVSDEVLGLLREQLGILGGAEPSAHYKELRDLMMTELPDEARLPPAT